MVHIFIYYALFTVQRYCFFLIYANIFCVFAEDLQILKTNGHKKTHLRRDAFPTLAIRLSTFRQKNAVFSPLWVKKSLNLLHKRKKSSTFAPDI